MRCRKVDMRDLTWDLTWQTAVHAAQLPYNTGVATVLARQPPLLPASIYVDSVRDLQGGVVGTMT
jgi:hypothetical protein